ncbi:peptidase G1 [Boletus edulis BED1]|uniref:Peptidase G1 n=1 Tax=Boletus edulis BED1 TaxID=1328754 RepID=A0AAD4BSV8_BOLED|nr:peptidase G1 [Boletus edulis BED1]
MLDSTTNGTSDGVHYNDRYAGAFWEETDGAFTFATATFNIPAQPAEQNYAVWVAIDGIQHNDSWFSAGINAVVLDNTETTYQAWCYWGNDVPYYFNVTIMPKDVIRASITAHNATSGTALIENLNNGQANVQNLQVNSTLSLLEGEVSWGVMLYQVNDTIPFDTVTITNATAYGPSGSIYKAEGANKLVIKQDNEVVTSVETTGSTITIQHVYE